MPLRLIVIYMLFLLFTSCASTSRERVIVGYDPIPIPPQQTIVIDPGHGGEDTGGHSSAIYQHQEKSLNLTTALLIDASLRRMGYQTLLTRGEDIHVPLKLRTAFANGNHSTLFVSIHYNAAPSPTAKGIEVYYCDDKDNPRRTELSKQLANTVLAHLIANTGACSRGVKQGNFAVIRETKMPAILVEGGFMTNKTECDRLKDRRYLQMVAESIALGIHDFLKTYTETTSRFGFWQRENSRN